MRRCVCGWWGRWTACVRAWGFSARGLMGECVCAWRFLAGSLVRCCVCAWGFVAWCLGRGGGVGDYYGRESGVSVCICICIWERDCIDADGGAEKREQRGGSREVHFVGCVRQRMWLFGRLYAWTKINVCG